jgi:hypothetical protein
VGGAENNGGLSKIRTKHVVQSEVDGHGIPKEQIRDDENRKRWRAQNHDIGSEHERLRKHQALCPPELRLESIGEEKRRK